MTRLPIDQVPVPRRVLRLRAVSGQDLDTPAARLARIRAIAQASARLPVQGPLSEADILGLGPDGLPD